MSVHSEEHNMDQGAEIDGHQPRLNEMAQKFLSDLESERKRLEENFPLCAFLIDDAIERVYSTGRIPGKEYYADVYKQKPIKITQKVFVPIKQYPKFNFVGKLLGPKGNSLRRLEDETQCRIAIKGRNSMRDRSKEEELRNSQDPRYSHLNKDLYVEITTVATPAEGYARVAYALAEIRKYLVPDKNDEVSHEQLRELMEIDPSAAKTKSNSTSSYYHRYGVSRKVVSSPSSQKYMSIIRSDPYSQGEVYEMEEEADVSSYESRMSKRPMPTSSSGYDYLKAKAVPSASAYKRPKAPVFDMKMKRLREAPEKLYKPSPYGILTKK